MRSPHPCPRPKVAINITPYIDILLVLLIIFMVIQPTTEYQLGARAPAKAEKRRDDTPEPPIRTNVIVVVVDEDFKLSINSQPVSFPQLGPMLFEILNTRADRTVFIKGPADLPFGDVVRIIDVAKGAGAGDIGLI